MGNTQFARPLRSRLVSTARLSLTREALRRDLPTQARSVLHTFLQVTDLTAR